MKIRELMDGIRNLDMVLPEFQREYVWQREQAKQLFVSLYAGYPTGSLLFWKTDQPPEIKNMAIARDLIGTTTVILDGQQRLTTLYLLTQHNIPPYYRPEDIRTDPRDLYFDLDSGDFQYFQVTRMRGNPTWVAVVDCFREGAVNPIDVAKAKTDGDIDPFQLAERYYASVTRLRNVLEHDYPIQTVPPSADVDEAIDVFDRVNSLGTKLSDADLALAHITGKWPQARQVMKKKIAELSERRFWFDLTFMTRCLTAVVKERALFETIHDTPADELKAGWDRLTKILDYLVTLLPGHAHVHSTEDLNTTNVLVPPVAYLAHHGTRFSDDHEMRRFVHWMYGASVWARYTSQTDQRLDHDISLIHQLDTPWPALVDAIIEQRGRIEVKPSDLEGRIIQHPLYRMAFVMAKSRGAIDWFNGSPLDAPHGTSYAIHSHHIFPTSILYSDEGGYDPENHLHKKLVNEIANRAFLTGQTNLALSNTPPAVYLPQIEASYPGALAKQFVPTDPALWELDRFADFLEARRRLLATAINERMTELLKEIERPLGQSVEELIGAGESPILEYKSSLLWDFRANQANKEMQKIIAKTIVGFLNFEGGTLLIGVADDGSIVGLTRDLGALGRGDLDGFEQKLRQIIADYIGAEYGQYVKTSYENVDGDTIAIIYIDPSPRPVYLRDRDAIEFYVRTGNTTRPLDVEASHDYIQMHWET
jgi:hypothetical protein